jgi:A-kinase anchor protein 5
MSLDQLYNNVRASVEALSTAFQQLEAHIPAPLPSVIPAAPRKSDIVVVVNDTESFKTFSSLFRWWADVYGSAFSVLSRAWMIDINHMDVKDVVAGNRVVFPLIAEQLYGPGENFVVHELRRLGATDILLLYVQKRNFDFPFKGGNSQDRARTEWAYLDKYVKDNARFVGIQLNNITNITRMNESDVKHKDPMTDVYNKLGVRALERWIDGLPEEQPRLQIPEAPPVFSMVTQPTQKLKPREEVRRVPEQRQEAPAAITTAGPVLPMFYEEQIIPVVPKLSPPRILPPPQKQQPSVSELQPQPSLPTVPQSQISPTTAPQVLEVPSEPEFSGVPKLSPPRVFPTVTQPTQKLKPTPVEPQEVPQPPTALPSVVFAQGPPVEQKPPLQSLTVSQEGAVRKPDLSDFVVIVPDKIELRALRDVMRWLAEVHKSVFEVLLKLKWDLLETVITDKTTVAGKYVIYAFLTAGEGKHEISILTDAVGILQRGKPVRVLLLYVQQFGNYASLTSQNRARLHYVQLPVEIQRYADYAGIQLNKGGIDEYNVKLKDLPNEKYNEQGVFLLEDWISDPMGTSGRLVLVPSQEQPTMIAPPSLPSEPLTAEQLIPSIVSQPPSEPEVSGVPPPPTPLEVIKAPSEPGLVVLPKLLPSSPEQQVPTVVPPYFPTAFSKPSEQLIPFAVSGVTPPPTTERPAPPTIAPPTSKVPTPSPQQIPTTSAKPTSVVPKPAPSFVIPARPEPSITIIPSPAKKAAPLPSIVAAPSVIPTSKPPPPSVKGQPAVPTRAEQQLPTTVSVPSVAPPPSVKGLPGVPKIIPPLIVVADTEKSLKDFRYYTSFWLQYYSVFSAFKNAIYIPRAEIQGNLVGANVVYVFTMASVRSPGTTILSDRAQDILAEKPANLLLLYLYYVLPFATAQDSARDHWNGLRENVQARTNLVGLKLEIAPDDRPDLAVQKTATNTVQNQPGIAALESWLENPRPASVASSALSAAPTIVPPLSQFVVVVDDWPTAKPFMQKQFEKWSVDYPAVFNALGTLQWVTLEKLRSGTKLTRKHAIYAMYMKRGTLLADSEFKANVENVLNAKPEPKLLLLYVQDETETNIDPQLFATRHAVSFKKTTQNTIPAGIEISPTKPGKNDTGVDVLNKWILAATPLSKPAPSPVKKAAPEFVIITTDRVDNELMKVHLISFSKAYPDAFSFLPNAQRIVRDDLKSRQLSGKRAIYAFIRRNNTSPTVDELGSQVRKVLDANPEYLLVLYVQNANEDFGSGDAQEKAERQWRQLKDKDIPLRAAVVGLELQKGKSKSLMASESPIANNTFGIALLEAWLAYPSPPAAPLLPQPTLTSVAVPETAPPSQLAQVPETKVQSTRKFQYDPLVFYEPPDTDRGVFLMEVFSESHLRFLYALKDKPAITPTRENEILVVLVRIPAAGGEQFHYDTMIKTYERDIAQIKARALLLLLYFESEQSRARLPVLGLHKKISIYTFVKERDNSVSRHGVNDKLMSLANEQ